MECLGQIRDRRVASSEPLQDATPGGIGQRREGGIESAIGILNHLVQFIRLSGPGCKSDLVSGRGDPWTRVKMLGDEAYLARLKVLRRQRDPVVARTAAGLPGERAVEWLRALGESLQAPETSKEKADLMHAIYERITVAGPEIVGVRLTAAA